MEMENIKNAASGIVTKSRLKKLGALLVLAAVVTGGASYYMHEQKIAHRTAAAAARSAMITAQAERENVSLISETEARSIAAAAIGKDESALTFRRVELANAADRDEKRDKHDKRDQHDKDKKHEKGEKHKERRDRGDVTQVAPIDKLSVVFAVLIALIFFGEHVSLMHGIAIALIAAGGLMLAIFP